MGWVDRKVFAEEVEDLGLKRWIPLPGKWAQGGELEDGVGVLLFLRALPGCAALPLRRFKSGSFEVQDGLGLEV